MEMKQLCKETGGIMVLCEGFEHEMFRKTLAKMFEKDETGHLKMGFNATIEVIVRTKTLRELSSTAS
jgi:protein transport protein SEC23